MERTLPLFLALVLSFSIAYAAVDAQLRDETYIVAVGDSAPASDVVFAANFASTMKANENAAFVGTTDDTLSDTLEGDYGSRVIVWLDVQDEQATIYVDDSSKRKAVANAAEDYLQDEGFDVERIEEDDSDSGSSGGSGKTPEPAKPTKPVKPVAVETPPAANNTSVVIDVKTTTPPAQKDTTVTVIAPAKDPVTPPEPEAPPRGLGKFWRWIKNLFG